MSPLKILYHLDFLHSASCWQKNFPPTFFPASHLTTPCSLSAAFPSLLREFSQRKTKWFLRKRKIDIESHINSNCMVEPLQFVLCEQFTCYRTWAPAGDWSSTKIYPGRRAKQKHHKNISSWSWTLNKANISNWWRAHPIYPLMISKCGQLSSKQRPFERKQGFSEPRRKSVYALLSILTDGFLLPGRGGISTTCAYCRA